MALTPNLAYLTAVLGALLVYLELVRPGRVLPGIAGLGLLVWGGFTLSHYPINYRAVMMIGAGLLFLLAEIQWNTRRVSLLGGTLFFAAGSARLLTGRFRLDTVVVVVATFVFVIVSLLLARAARLARENKRRDLVK
jgi:membrane-bound serine protease (ClpP class)